MTASSCLFRRLLVVAPHPDDEAIAAWALIRRLKMRGSQVDVIVVSDGGASHPGSATWPRPRLVARRRSETRGVLRPLGVTADRIRFVNLPDGALATEAALRRQLAKTILRRRAPNLIVAPMPDDEHADHQAVGAALAALPRRGERRAGYRVWPEGAGRQLHGLIMPLRPCEVPMKRSAIRRYRTQAGLITDAVAGFTMTHRHLRAFSRPSERFAWL